MKKAELRRELDLLTNNKWRGDMEVESDLNKKGDKTLPKFKRLKEEGGKNFEKVCDELGTLGVAAKAEASAVVNYLLEQGVSVNAESEKSGRGNALWAVTTALGKDVSEKTLGIIKLFLEAGADVGTGKPSTGGASINFTSLDNALLSGNEEVFELLVSHASKEAQVQTLTAAIVEKRARPHLPLALRTLHADGIGHKGLTPLHAAATTGRVDIYQQVAARAEVQSPKLKEAGPFMNWDFPSQPGGGTIPSTYLQAGSTPLDVLRAVRVMFVRGVGVYEREQSLSDADQTKLKGLVAHLAEFDEVQALMVKAKVESALSAAELPGDHGLIALELLRLAARVDAVDQMQAVLHSFDPASLNHRFIVDALERAVDILAPTGSGHDHPFASLVTGAHAKRKVVCKSAGTSDEKTFIAKLKKYPKDSRLRIQNALIGMHAGALLTYSFENKVDSISLITEESMTSLGPTTTFVRSGVDMLLSEAS